MKLLLQRVKNGAVHINGTSVASIEHGLVVLVGFGAQDTETLPTSAVWNTMLQKMIGLRIFSDEQGKMNLSLKDTGNNLLLVPQFTLYADSRRGRRPSFTSACPPAIATKLFDTFVENCKAELPERVQCGVFGADMDVSLTNWGPVTIMLASEDFA
ncbi:D-aminoacyl-tRNA deacylase [Halodesulfovibrio spirochaetisodalis]|uniref:D-aminoacyl-tRNA deacylase n=1 Tax=Halodesulfovibrio spirochaetisodalis TaxID=1560234 RepID=A0A1B7X987_9BACT|nr:D-aminoacyl-tRNA deacylase [Halodesulfovibrio spirochaetisodalis]OBQ45860.1 D-tyrosyl-tRNA(Tyr) deacylase [Halodesulfovibrio spirochaetisodalis]